MRQLVPVLLVLATGCASGTAAPHAASSPPPSSSPGRAASAARADQVLAVITASGGLELYGVGPRAVAHRLRTLSGPKGAQAERVTLSGGADPRVCAVWSGGAPDTLRCYDSASGDSHDVPTGGGSLRGGVGLSSSGQGLAWVGQGPAGNDPALFVQRAIGGPVISIPDFDSPPGPDERAIGVGDVCWSGDDTVVLSTSVDDDVNGSISQVSVSTPPRGLTDARYVNAPSAWPVLSGTASSTTDGRVLAVLEGFSGNAEPMEAAELDLRTGRVVSVVSVPAKGRRMFSVSGGPDGVVYRTDGDSDVRTYWRAPGKAHGSPVVGLPAGAREVIAQP